MKNASYDELQRKREEIVSYLQKCVKDDIERGFIGYFVGSGYLLNPYIPKDEILSRFKKFIETEFIKESIKVVKKIRSIFTLDVHKDKSDISNYIDFIFERGRHRIILESNIDAIKQHFFRFLDL